MARRRRPQDVTRLESLTYHIPPNLLPHDEGGIDIRFLRELASHEDVLSVSASERGGIYVTISSLRPVAYGYGVIEKIITSGLWGKEQDDRQ